MVSEDVHVISSTWLILTLLIPVEAVRVVLVFQIIESATCGKKYRDGRIVVMTDVLKNVVCCLPRTMTSSYKGEK